MHSVNQIIFAIIFLIPGEKNKISYSRNMHTHTCTYSHYITFDYFLIADDLLYNDLNVLTLLI